MVLAPLMSAGEWLKTNAIVSGIAVKGVTADYYIYRIAVTHRPMKHTRVVLGYYDIEGGETLGISRRDPNAGNGINAVAQSPGATRPAPRRRLKKEETMCKIFISAEPALYEGRTRSLRLHNVVTSIRLENLFWDVLAEIGRRDGMTVTQLVTKLHDEIVEAHGEVENFASFLRVCCLRYRSLQVAGAIPTDLSVAIRSLDADAVLAREPRRFDEHVSVA
jgi:predicted DNA-binding ribbon-helix-helix protein